MLARSVHVLLLLLLRCKSLADETQQDGLNIREVNSLASAEEMSHCRGSAQ